MVAEQNITEQSRATVLAFVENFSAGRVEAALALLAEDSTWWVAGTPGQFPLAGLRSKTELLELLVWIGSVLPHGVDSTVLGVTAEGERVAVEVETGGTTVAGTRYANRLHFLFEVRAGKIRAVREYLDTLHVQTVLVGARHP